VVLVGRLEEALRRLNPKLPQPAINEALRKVLIPDAPSLLQNNCRLGTSDGTW
jgi:type I restriction enzyme, R subunit